MPRMMVDFIDAIFFARSTDGHASALTMCIDPGPRYVHICSALEKSARIGACDNKLPGSQRCRRQASRSLCETTLRLWNRAALRPRGESLGRELSIWRGFRCQRAIFEAGTKFFFECCFESTAPSATVATVPPPFPRDRQISWSANSTLHKKPDFIGVFARSELF
jgi:hypothetical protein